MLNLDIGSGSTFSLLNNFVCTDIHNFNLLNKPQMRNFLIDYKIRHVLAEHIFEHLSSEEMIQAIKNLNEFMEIGSRIRIDVPDGYNPSREYISNVCIGGKGPGAHDHKQLLDHDLISNLFNQNFPNQKIKFIEYFDKNGVFHSKSYLKIGKEIKRSSLSNSYSKSFHLSHLSLIFDYIKISY